MLYNPKYPEIQFFAKMKIFWDFVLHVLHDQREISENSADFVLFRFESEKHYLQILILKCEWKYPSHMNDSFMRSKKIEIKACIDVILMFGVDVSAALMKPLTLREIIHFDRQQSFLTLSEIRGLSYNSDQLPACSGFPHGLYGWIRNQCQSFNNIVYAFSDCCLLLCGYFWC